MNDTEKFSISQKMYEFWVIRENDKAKERLAVRDALVEYVERLLGAEYERGRTDETVSHYAQSERAANAAYERGYSSGLINGRSEFLQRPSKSALKEVHVVQEVDVDESRVYGIATSHEEAAKLAKALAKAKDAGETYLGTDGHIAVDVLPLDTFVEEGA